METKEQKYRDGEIVFAIKHPIVRLIVRRYIPTIYYCTVADDPTREVVYFERELMPGTEQLFTA